MIEIPKGDDRRRHLNKYHKTTFVDLGPMKDHIKVNDGVAPEHYGYIPNTHNPSDEDEVDVILFADDAFTVGERVEAEAIALLSRADGDHKVIAVIPGTYENWEHIPEERRELVLRFFSTKHPITSIGTSAETERYIQESSMV